MSNVVDLTVGNRGTVYMCRVMYGALSECNVYLTVLCEWSVAAYNGTTENYVESCVESGCYGHEPVLEIDIEATVYSADYYTSSGVDSSEVAWCVTYWSEGVHVTVAALVVEFEWTAGVWSGLLSSAGSGEEGIPSVLDV